MADSPTGRTAGFAPPSTPCSAGSRVGRAHRCYSRFLTVIAIVAVALLAGAPGALLSGSPAAAAPTDSTVDQIGRFARIIVDSLTPSMVTSSSGPTVSVTGHVVNTSSRTLRDLGIRLERGDALTSADQLRTALAAQHPPVAASTDFTNLSADTLAPGAQASFALTVPLSGPGGLQISQRGVYPIQLNVNGLPDYGGVAQVAGSRTLLPVLSLPPDASRATSFVDAGGVDGLQSTPGLGPDGSVSADVSDPSRFTLLWPIAAPPQLAPGVLGGGTEPVRLISEDMATSLEPGGRLNSLLAPLQSITGTTPDNSSTNGGSDSSSGSPSRSAMPSGVPDNQPAPQDPDLARSICLAVDPDLLITVRAMSLGYVVSSNPSDPTAPTTPGTGQDAAAGWLRELQAIASRTCVVALPFAAADLSSLAQIGSAGLTTDALDSPADLVDNILGVKSVRGLTIPALGAIDQSGAQVIANSANKTVLTSAGNLSAAAPSTSGAYRVGDLTAQSYDEPVTAALAALGTNPSTPAITPNTAMVDLPAESALSRRQAGVGALAYAAISGVGAQGATAQGDGADELPTTGRSQVILPSLYWSPTTDDAAALISTAQVLLGSRAATATPLTNVIDGANAARSAARLATPPGIGTLTARSVPMPSATAATMREQADLSWRLQGAFVDSTDVETSPERYLGPLRQDLLRAITVPATTGVATTTRLAATCVGTVGAVESTLSRMRSAVAILDPGGRYTLASERSPLLLVVKNDLALPIRVNISTNAPRELNVGDVGTIEIPARGTRQLQLPTRSDTSEAISVNISIATVTGVPLGTDIRLSVHSNAYGKPLFIITIIAGAALVLLTARRLWRRFRGEPDPADADRPEPGEQERLLAAATYQQRRRTLHIEETHPVRPPGDHVPDPTPPDNPGGPDGDMTSAPTAQSDSPPPATPTATPSKTRPTT